MDPVADFEAIRRDAAVQSAPASDTISGEDSEDHLPTVGPVTLAHFDPRASPPDRLWLLRHPCHPWTQMIDALPDCLAQCLCVTHLPPPQDQPVRTVDALRQSHYARLHVSKLAAR